MLTDAALASEHCQWEVSETLRLGKRILPLVHGPSRTRVPLELAKLNYVFSDDPGMGDARPAAPSPSALQKLSDAIDVDIRWVREHARLTAQARRWEAQGPEDTTSNLLRRGEVEAAKAWIRLRPGKSAPVISSALVAYIDTSEQHERVERDAKNLLVQRAFAVFVDKAQAKNDHHGALRRMAAGALLSEDVGFELDARETRAGQEAWLARAEHRFGLWRSGLKALQHMPVMALGGSGGKGVAFAWSKDEKYLLTVREHAVHVWDAASGALIAELAPQERSSSIERLVMSPCGKQFATILHWGGPARVWSLETFAQKAVFGGRGGAEEIWSAAFSADGNRLIVGYGKGIVDIWDVRTAKRVCPAKRHGKAPPLIAFGASGRIAIASGNSVRVLDGATGAEIATFETTNHHMESLALNSQGDHVALANHSGEPVSVWNIATGALLESVGSDDGEGELAFAFTPDGSGIATASYGGSTTLWDLDTGKARLAFARQQAAIGSVAINHDGTLVATGLANGNATVWDAVTGKQLAAFSGHEGSVRALTFSPDGSRLAAAAEDRSVRVWNCNNEQAGVFSTLNFQPITAQFCGDGAVAAGSFDFVGVRREGASEAQQIEGAQTPFVVSPDGAVLAARTRGSLVSLYDARTASKLADFGESKSGARLEHLVFSSNGELLVTWAGGAIGLWDVKTRVRKALISKRNEWRGQMQRMAVGAETCVIAASFEHDGLYLWNGETGAEVTHLLNAREWALNPRGDLIAVGETSGVSLYTTSSGEKLTEFHVHGHGVGAIRFTPDGLRIAVLSPGAPPEIHRIEAVLAGDRGSEAPELILRGHVDVDHLALSGDGELLATGSGDGTVRLWDASTGAEVAELPGPHENRIVDLSFNRERTRLLSISREGRAAVWDIGWTKAIGEDRRSLVGAALQCGLGELVEADYSDPLMHDAPVDLCAAWVAATPEAGRMRLAEIARVLRTRCSGPSFQIILPR